jgi:hypothetical protein
MNVSNAPARCRRFFACLLAAVFVLQASASLVRAADPSTFTVGAFTFKRPSAWLWVPTTSSMRKAQLRVPDPTNPANTGAEVVFFHFGAGQGGGVESNISRWVGQFSDLGDKKPIIEKAEIKGNKITRVRIESGTFSSGMPGGPTTPLKNFGMCGAIIESAQGDVFVKMTGPAEIVNAAVPNFDALVQSPF